MYYVIPNRWKVKIKNRSPHVLFYVRLKNFWYYFCPLKRIALEMPSFLERDKWKETDEVFEPNIHVIVPHTNFCAVHVFLQHSYILIIPKQYTGICLNKSLCHEYLSLFPNCLQAVSFMTQFLIGTPVYFQNHFSEGINHFSVCFTDKIENKTYWWMSSIVSKLF